MRDTKEIYGSNVGYVLEQYELFVQNPNLVDADTRAFFSDSNFDITALYTSKTNDAPNVPNQPYQNGWTEEQVLKAAGTARLARFIRSRGHYGANIDPLRFHPYNDPETDLKQHNLTDDDLRHLPSSVVGGPIAARTKNAYEAIQELRKVYTSSIGYDCEHLQNADERHWLRDEVEEGSFLNISGERMRQALERLTAVEGFELFLQTTFLGQKRFSIEGTDSLIPMLDEIIHTAASGGTRHVLFGMAHRGRLNVLAHILHKPYAKILSEFEKAARDHGASVSGRGSRGWQGDVKYHLGFADVYHEDGLADVKLTLVPNPSHLEFVNPVVQGFTRAIQDDRSKSGEPKFDAKKALAIAIHGDAAFMGQGVVAETLNMSQLHGYQTGGTIHIIVNNQIGFMTLPSDSRSTFYASDLAKGFDVPVVHVNADDPLACLAVAQMALAYRQKFHKDFVIDLIGYRRRGHNENEEPSFTQPEMYEVIRKHPTVRQIWAERLERAGLVTAEEVRLQVEKVKSHLQQEHQRIKNETAATPTPTEPPFGSAIHDPDVITAVPEGVLLELNAQLRAVPQGFTPNDKLERNLLNKRHDAIREEKAINWGHAEALALGSLLRQGTSIRISGQDAQPGTFGHRHATLHDFVTGNQHIPLQHLPSSNASFAAHNSPLSEMSVLGFEYGYSICAKETLTIWEAQFGDFGNGAQVIFDQFLVSGFTKWQQTSSIVILLPHGYEGQGPEHSSGRLERFLQMAADDNLRVANCTTPAQYFHLLRLQAGLLKLDPRPLIIMTPKSLLREPLVGSSLSDLTQGTFQLILNDTVAMQDAKQVTTLILCSGKVYVDLIKHPDFASRKHQAAVRIEQLFPFPTQNLTALKSQYPKVKEVIWLQEEPKNMGAWTFVAPYLEGIFKGVRYVGRPEAASPAEGSKSRHDAQQAKIIAEAICSSPHVG